MIQQNFPEGVYKNKVEEFTVELKRLKLIRTRLGWARLAVVVFFVFVAWNAFQLSTLAGLTAVIAGIAALLFLVAKDVKNNRLIAHNNRLLFINEQELLVGALQYTHRENGIEFLPKEHAYANDLDLFGAFSLYQFVNRCTSEQAKQLLAENLLNACMSQSVIDRQEAIKEINKNIGWRQQLMALGMAEPITKGTENKIEQWLKLDQPYQSPSYKTLSNFYPVLTLGVTAAYMFGYIHSAIFSMIVFVFLLFSLWISRKIAETYSALSKIVDEVATLQEQLRHLENLHATSSLLVRLKASLQSKKTASDAIKDLKNILNRFDYRLNFFVFIILNTFLLWDLRQLLSLNKWKAINGAVVKKWFEALAEIEVMNTLSTLAFNHPVWVFPKISDAHFTFNGKNIGHPLIDPLKRVDNSFDTNGQGKVSIITGSNMAGKSTFLRSIGVNLVLAQVGSPVCAGAFVFSPVKLYSSMRIADNLAENTSTFYAELKKLKTIIDQVKDHQKIFILLDEILRGTNSLDRHTGSEALIKQLIREQAVAVIATHDVELAALETEYKQSIENYHFDVQVAGEELYFDYKLKGGVCKSMNASILMKKIGIEIV
ncbi:MAG: hypothetical protein JWQ96_2402 [Segetibacter sp.]|nr:hypothetical protein [Segetibacter sp.]